MLKVTLCDEAFKICLNNNHMASQYVTETRNMRIAAAQNDTPAVQLLISSDEAVAVNLSPYPYFSKTLGMQNLRISINCAFSYEMFEVGMVTDDDGLEKGDILLPVDNVEITDGNPKCIYIRFYIPPQTNPGRYRADISIFRSTMFEEEEKIDHSYIEFEVYSVAIPKERSFRLDLWQHLTNIAHKHDVRLWSDEHFEVLEEYVKSLAALGQKSATIIVSEDPWRGQSCYKDLKNKSNLFEYSMIQTEKTEEGKYLFDYSTMKRYIDLCDQYGTAEEIEVFGILNVWSDEENGFKALAPDYPDYIRVRYFDRKSGTYNYMKDAKDIDQFIRSLEQYFISEGLISRVKIASDEPANMELFSKSLNHLKWIAPSFRYKTAINHAEFIGEFHKDFDVFAPYLYCVCNKWDQLEQYRHQYSNKTFQWYVCCAPKELNTFIKSNLLESRYIGILTSYMNYDGFLRWNYTVWPEEPRKDIRYGEFPAGDVNFVYPGNNGKPVLSLRYEQLKRGIDDFELLKIAKQAGLTGAVEKFYSKVVKEGDIRELYGEEEYIIRPVQELCSLNYCDYAEAREQLLCALALKY